LAQVPQDCFPFARKSHSLAMAFAKSSRSVCYMSGGDSAHAKDYVKDFSAAVYDDKQRHHPTAPSESRKPRVEHSAPLKRPPAHHRKSTLANERAQNKYAHDPQYQPSAVRAASTEPRNDKHLRNHAMPDGPSSLAKTPYNAEEAKRQHQVAANLRNAIKARMTGPSADREGGGVLHQAMAMAV